jgi:hypothetical protein
MASIDPRIPSQVSAHVFPLTCEGEKRGWRRNYGQEVLRWSPGRQRSSPLATRRKIEEGWHAVGEILLSQGHPELAADVRRFVSQMPPAATEKELLAMKLLERSRDPPFRKPPSIR